MEHSPASVLQRHAKFSRANFVFHETGIGTFKFRQGGILFGKFPYTQPRLETSYRSQHEQKVRMDELQKAETTQLGYTREIRLPLQENAYELVVFTAKCIRGNSRFILMQRYCAKVVYL